MRTRLFIIMAAVLVCTAVVTAGNVQLNLISNDADWFSHFDMQKFDGSVLHKIADGRGLTKKCEDIKNEIGLDPIKDITGVTMYGSIDAPRNAVVIIKGGLNAQSLEELVVKQPEYTASQYGEFIVHSWKSNKGEKKSGAFYDNDTLVMSKSKDAIIAAIDVLSGKAPNIASSGCITSEDAIYQAYMGDASTISSKSEHLMFLANVKKTLLAVGQKDTDVFSELIMQADTTENALLLEQMAQGMLAISQMQAAQQKTGALEIIRKINVSIEDTTVVTSAVLTTTEVDQMISSQSIPFVKIFKSFQSNCGKN